MSLSLYAFVLFVHVLAGAFLIGSSLGAPLVRRAVESACTFEELRRWLDFGHRSHKANPLIALILLASGVYLGASGWWSTGWFYVSLVAWIANSALAGLVIQRTAASLARETFFASGNLRDSLDVFTRTTGWHVADNLMIANDIAILYLMMAKPAAVMSIVIFAGANIVALAAGGLARRRAGRLQTA